MKKHIQQTHFLSITDTCLRCTDKTLPRKTTCKHDHRYEILNQAKEVKWFMYFCRFIFYVCQCKIFEYNRLRKCRILIGLLILIIMSIQTAFHRMLFYSKLLNGKIDNLLQLALHTQCYEYKIICLQEPFSILSFNMFRRQERFSNLQRYLSKYLYLLKCIYLQ